METQVSVTPFFNVFTWNFLDTTGDVHHLDPPAEKDSAATRAPIRRRICNDVTGAEGYFWSFNNNIRAIDAATMRYKLSHPRYQNIFDEIFESERYTNPYRRRKFKVFGFGGIEEYVFVCVLLNWTTDRIFPIYVSKEYNVSLPGESYKPGRFVFMAFVPRNPDSFDFITFAEEPVSIYAKSGFHVELHYLQRRKYFQSGNCAILTVAFSSIFFANIPILFAIIQQRATV